MSSTFPLITVLGPTAVGKTSFAAHLALLLDAEIISADSRQVFIGMDIGTGKDMADYTVSDKVIPSHLIDIAEAGTEYSVFRFQQDFHSAWSGIVNRGKIPLMCGGTGLYLEAVLKGYNLVKAPVDDLLRQRLIQFSDKELAVILKELKPLHNTTDILERDRLIRAIEIETYRSERLNQPVENKFLNSPVIGIKFERKIIRQRITARLTQRLNNGMVEEVQHLLDQNIPQEKLKMYGLEYKYITMFLNGELTYNEMFIQLNTAIHQFAKRQMTWFRRMENNGIQILWLHGEDGMNENLDKVKNYLHLP